MTVYAIQNFYEPLCLLILSWLDNMVVKTFISLIVTDPILKTSIQTRFYCLWSAVGIVHYELCRPIQPSLMCSIVNSFSNTSLFLNQSKKMIFLQDNAKPHTARVVRTTAFLFYWNFVKWLPPMQVSLNLNCYLWRKIHFIWKESLYFPKTNLASCTASYAFLIVLLAVITPI